MSRLVGVENAKDGTTVLARLDSEPAGESLVRPAFLVGVDPRQPFTEVPAAAIRCEGPGLYRLDLSQVGYSAGGVDPASLGARWPRWVSYRDAEGEGPALPVWVCVTDGVLMLEVAEALQADLLAQRALLDLRLATLAPEGRARVRDVLIVAPATAEEYPYIDISVTARTDEPYEIHPATYASGFRAQIAAVAWHNARVSWRPAITALGEAIRDVLNADYNLDRTLPSGLTLGACWAREVQVSEVEDGDRCWTIATLSWSGETGIPA